MVGSGRKAVLVEGPLAPHAPGFGAHLIGRGYAPSSAEEQLRLMAHLSRWLAERRTGPAALRPEAVERFRDVRRAGSRKLKGRRALGPLLGYLAGLGLLPEPPADAPTLLERLLAEYRDYLCRCRAAWRQRRFGGCLKAATARRLWAPGISRS